VNKSNLRDNKNPPGFDINFDLLREFEANLDPQSPENCRIPCHVLGYGEISTVFEIKVGDMDGVALKRMSVFENQEELGKYLTSYQEYNNLLENEAGLQLPPHGYAIAHNPSGRPILYLIQAKLPSYAICNNAIHLLSRQDIVILIVRVLHELHKIWLFNQGQSEHKLAIDGQISNWVIGEFDPDAPNLGENSHLSYVDTSTPQYLSNGVEQLNPELFLRSAPSFLVWIIRKFLLEDVMTRYYDPRNVVIDLLANFYKEQRADLIPDLVFSANTFFASEAKELAVEPLEVQELSDYYREDAFIWRFFLNSRRLDRFLHLNILRREYPYILPGKIKR
jgi:hypothetical protein